MPAILPATSKIGTLLRLLEESASEKPTETMAADQPSSPMRETVEAPLETPIAPESPGSERNISLKPEGSTAPGAETPPGAIMPSSSKIGPIGGIPGGVETATPVPMEGEPQLQPTMEDYLNRGKTAAQWYAETGRQGTLDVIGSQASKGGVGNFNQFLETGRPANADLSVNPQTGETYATPRPTGEPNTATLQDYLSQGKTAEQWYAETGRQSELDNLTRGGTLPIPAQSLTTNGIRPQGFVGPLKQPGGQVLGSQAISPSTPEVMGPFKPGADLLPQQLLEPIESTPQYSLTPTPTPIPGSLRVKLDKAQTKEEVQAVLNEWIASNPEARAYLEASNRISQ